MNTKKLSMFIKGFFLSLIVVSLIACANKSDESGGEDGPEPPVPPEPLDSLKFTAIQNDSSVSYKTSAPLDNIDIQVSINSGNNWKEWDGTAIPLAIGDSICVKNKNNTLSKSFSNYFYFDMTGKISASGNVNSMINYGELTDYCYSHMFESCFSLITAPELPSIKLAECCYNRMFQNCTFLTTAPELPAEELVNGCYKFMFQNCTNIKIIEEENSANGKYCKIFTCPSIPPGSVDSMFDGTKISGFQGEPVEGYTYYWYKNEPLKFTAIKDSGVGFTTDGLSTSINIQYSKDEGNNWKAWDGSFISLKKDESICVKNVKNTLSKSSTAYFQFVMLGKIVASGDVASMINYSDLTNYCYYYMFKGCTSLISAPELPATTLTQHCYDSMFYDCTSLASTPELPAETLAIGCYANMFYNCISLTAAPELPAETLVDYCYQYMFENCKNIRIIEEETPTNSDYKIFTCPNIVIDSVTLMFNNTKAGGFQGTPTEGYTYYCHKEEPLKFTATQDNSSVGYILDETLSDIDIQVSMNDGIDWEPWDGTVIPLNNHDNICVKNNNSVLSTDSDKFVFTMTGEISASGSVNSMINYCELVDNCFSNMFYNCTSLIVAPELPAEILAQGCYSNMFKSCTSLIVPPELPSLSLECYCYDSMFASCTSLTTAPALPAEALAEHCYNNMFADCRSLKIREENGLTNKADKIFTCPVLQEGSVNSMFDGTKIDGYQREPVEGNTYCWCQELKFTATEDNSKVGYSIHGTLNDIDIEFSINDSGSWQVWNENVNISLNSGDSICVKNDNNTLSDENNYFEFNMSGKILASGSIDSMVNYDNLTPYCYYHMFGSCDALISAPKLPAKTLSIGCYKNMFEGCFQLASAPELPAKTLAESCYYSMFAGCTSLISAPKLPAKTLSKGCYYSMFQECFSLTSAPELPATTLADYCYNSMFIKCLNLKIKEDVGATIGMRRIFTCPSVGTLNDPVGLMFYDVDGSFNRGTPAEGNTYYWY